MRDLEYKTANANQSEIAELRKQNADLNAALTQLTTNTNAGIAPIAGLNQTVNNLAKRVAEIQVTQASAVATIADLASVPTPANLARVSVVETGLRYEFKTGIYIAGIPGNVDTTTGVWVPVNKSADPSWIRSQDFPNHYQRTLKGVAINRVQFDICQRDDRTKIASLDIIDFSTGCTVSGYWGIMGRFFDQVAVDRTLKVFLGADTTTGRVLIAIQDPGITNPKFCWVRNVRINGLSADLLDVGEIARAGFPKN